MTPRGEAPDKSIIFRSDFRKAEFEVYQRHVAPSIMEDEFALKTNKHLYIDEPIPSTLLLSGPDGMRPGLLAKTLAQLLDADFQEILHWRQKGTLDLVKGFAVTGEEKRDKVIFIRDLALLGRDLQGAKETAHTVLYDQVKISIKALQQRKNQVDHRMYVVAATAYEEALPDDIKALFEKKYVVTIPNEETAAALVGDFVKSLNGIALPLDQKCVSSLKGFDFDDLKELVNEAAKGAVRAKKEAIALDDLEQALPKTCKRHEKMSVDRVAMIKVLTESKKPVIPDKEVYDGCYEQCVLEQVPVALRHLYEHRVFDNNPLCKDVPVYLLFGKRGLGKMTTAQALADRRNAELVMMTAEELFDPVVGKTQKNIENFFDGLQQRDKKGDHCIAMLRGIERLVTANNYGDEEYEISTLRASLLNKLKKVGEHTVVLLCADTQQDKVHSELVATVGKDRCALFEKPKESSVRKALLVSLAQRLCVRNDTAVDYADLAEKTESFNCTDLENLVRSAARKAVAENAGSVQKEHYEKALIELQELVDDRDESKTTGRMYC